MTMAVASALRPRWLWWRGVRRLLLTLLGLASTALASFFCLDAFPDLPAVAIMVGAIGIGVTALVWQQSGRRLPAPSAYARSRLRALPRPGSVYGPVASSAHSRLSDAVQLAGATLYYLHRAATKAGGRPLKREAPLVSLFSGIAVFLFTAYRGRGVSAEHSIATAEGIISRYWAKRRTEKGGSVALVAAAFQPEDHGLPIGGFVLAHLCGDGAALERLVDLAMPGLAAPERDALARVAAELVADLTDHLGTPPASATDVLPLRPAAGPWRYQ